MMARKLEFATNTRTEKAFKITVGVLLKLLAATTLISMLCVPKADAQYSDLPYSQTQENVESGSSPDYHYYCQNYRTSPSDKFCESEIEKLIRYYADQYEGRNIPSSRIIQMSEAEWRYLQDRTRYNRKNSQSEVQPFGRQLVCNTLLRC